MIYLSGVVMDAIATAGPDGQPRKDLGVLITPNMGNRPEWLPRAPHAFDNGMFAQPDRFVLADYLAWLRSMAPLAQGCLFATAPDVVGNAAATLALSGPALPLIRSAGYKVALVAQDGLEDLVDRLDWGSFDALFIGGSTEWKLSPHAARVIRAARAHGRWVHMGRVNSYRRLRIAKDWGCQSADGTFLAVAPDQNFPRLTGWLDKLRRLPTLMDWARGQVPA